MVLVLYEAINTVGARLTLQSEVWCTMVCLFAVTDDASPIDVVVSLR